MEIFRYTQWVWRSWEFWQKCFFVAMILNVSSLLFSQPYNTYILASGMSIIWAWVFKWWIWEPAKKSYKEYKTQRDGLFDTIKGN